MVGSQGWVCVLRAGRGWAVRWASGPGGSAGCCVQGARWARRARAGRPSGACLAGAGSGRGQAGAQACGSVGLSGHRLGYGSRGALQALSAHMVVLLPVLVLAEGAAVAGCVATAACLAGLAPTIPAALEVRGDDQGGPYLLPVSPEHPPSCRPGTCSKHTSSNPATASQSKKRRKLNAPRLAGDPLQTWPLAWATLGGQAPTTPAHSRQVHGVPWPLPSLSGIPPGTARALIPECHSLGRVKGW